jgi:hypothetical protein
MSAKSTAEKNISPQIICESADDVKEVRALPDYCLEVEFMDKTSGKVYMKDLIFSPKAGVFAALKDQALFNRVCVKYGVTTWPGEIDLAPDAMYAEFKKHGQWVLK